MSIILNEGPPVARPMEHGQVRAILGRHALGGADGGRPADPTLLVPAGSLRRALEALDDAGQRALALDYVQLWARTFRTLARHLRGRPERALALFAEEVYPFLRGDRRAARIERVHRHEARILLPGDLPAAYHCGLLEGFVGLSGARAVARSDAAGAFTIAFHVAPADRLARSSQQLAALRIPLLSCVALAAVAGLVAAVAARDLTGLHPLVVVAGVLAAQLGANALHGLRTPAGSPFAASRIPHPALLAGALVAYLVAATCAVAATLAAGWPILAFAASGLALGLAYAKVREGGLGPAVAALTYGVLVPVGTAYAVAGPEAWPMVFAVFLSLPLGLASAALLLLDNMSDRPLDEAGGQRTLAVRLGGRGQAVAFVGLIASALAWLAVTGLLLFRPLAFPALVALALAPLAVWLCRRVARNSDDPRALGAARVAAFAFAMAIGLVPVIDLAVYL